MVEGPPQSLPAETLQVHRRLPLLGCVEAALGRHPTQQLCPQLLPQQPQQQSAQ